MEDTNKNTNKFRPRTATKLTQISPPKTAFLQAVLSLRIQDVQSNEPYRHW
jgi:hypothetical protein